MALNFSSGDDGAISVGDPTELQDLDPFTATMWIYPTGWGENNYGRLICKEYATPAGWVWFLSNYGSGNGTETVCLLRWRATTDTNLRGADYAISLNEWQHIAVDYNSTASKLYVNGTEISYSTYVAGAGAITTDVGQNLYMANRPADLARDFDGRQEDARLYNRSLSAAEIMAIYLGRGHDNIVEGLLGRWTMTEKAPGVTISSDSVIDLSVNGNDGSTLYSGTPYGEGVIALRRKACSPLI